MSKIELTKIPESIRNNLKEAGVDFASDGKKNDLSSLDILNANYKLWNDHWYGMSEKVEGSYNKLKYALSTLFVYLRDNGNLIVADKLQKEISATSPMFGNSFEKIDDQMKSIHGREILAEKGILFSCHPDLPPTDIMTNNLTFSKNGKDIKLTYYNCKVCSHIDVPIDTEGLKEIRIEGIYHKGYWTYCVKAIYDYKDIGRKERILG